MVHKATTDGTNCIIGGYLFGAGVLLRCPVCALPSVRLRCTPTSATRFVKAQATMLHFPQAENSTCVLASPFPAKPALRGPQVFLPPAALPSLPGLVCICAISADRGFATVQPVATKLPPAAWIGLFESRSRQ